MDVSVDTTLAAPARLRLPGVVRTLGGRGLPWPAWLEIDGATVEIRGLWRPRSHRFRPGTSARWQTPRRGSARLELRGSGEAVSFRPRHGARRLTSELERRGFAVAL